MEIWKRIEGTDFYDVSNEGRVRSRNYLGHGTTKVLALAKDHKGYLRVRLFFGSRRKNCKVHRLVAEAFIPNPGGLPEVNHKDGDKTNNRVDNLEWSTAHDNTVHAYRSGLKEETRKSSRRLGQTKGKEALSKYMEIHKIPVVAVNLQTGEETEYESATEAARRLGVPQSNVWKALNGQRRSAGGYAFRERR